MTSISTERRFRSHVGGSKGGPAGRDERKGWNLKGFTKSALILLSGCMNPVDMNPVEPTHLAVYRHTA